MRAISIPFFTGELKSTRSCLIVPDTWVPTWTVITAFSVPVAEIVDRMSPRSTGAVRNVALRFPLPNQKKPAAPPRTRTARIKTSTSLRRVIRRVPLHR